MSDLGWIRQQLGRIRLADLHITDVRLSVEPGADDGTAVLVVDYRAGDSRNPGQKINLCARRSIHTPPMAYHLVGEIRKALLHGLLEHELDEHLHRDGVLLHDPHQDPDRWHCPCGGVGPVRQADTWTCPGCGTTHETGGQ